MTNTWTMVYATFVAISYIYAMHAMHSNDKWSTSFDNRLHCTTCTNLQSFAFCLDTLYGLRGSNVPWFMCCFRRYVNCLFVCLLNFLSDFLPSSLFSFLMLFFLLICFLTCLIPDLSSYFFQNRPNMALVLGFILCFSTYCYGCMFAFVVFVSVCQY